MPRKTFVAGEILTAADVNTNLMDQTVMVFAGTAARGSAIPSPSEGMVTYLEDVNQVQAYTGSAFKPVSSILQVVSTTKSDTFSTTSTAYTPITGLSVTITPSSTNSKIMIFATVSIGASATIAAPRLRFTRNGSAVGVGDLVGSRAQATSGAVPDAGTDALTAEYNVSTVPMEFLDSPASTSALTYAIDIRRGSSTRTLQVNRNDDYQNDGDAQNSTLVSSITVMEVAG
jgi:hypothetical protein